MGTNLPRERYINSDKLNIHIVEWGDPTNQPVILLHHVSSQARTWDNFASIISDDYYVIAIDMRGHGDSDWANEGEYTTEHYAYDVEQLAINMGLKNIIVFLKKKYCLIHGKEINHPKGSSLNKRLIKVLNKVEKVIANSEYTKNLAINKLITEENILPFTPQPYRITIKLSGSNPAAPAETLTKALRKAGVIFEVEMIERVESKPLKISPVRGVRR